MPRCPLKMSITFKTYDHKKWSLTIDEQTYNFLISQDKDAFKKYLKIRTKDEKQSSWISEGHRVKRGLICVGICALITVIGLNIFDEMPSWVDSIGIVVPLSGLYGIYELIGYFMSKSEFGRYLSFVKLPERIRKDLIDRSDNYNQYRAFEDKKRSEGQNWGLFS